jgi:hypothetical protein
MDGHQLLSLVVLTSGDGVADWPSSGSGALPGGSVSGPRVPQAVRKQASIRSRAILGMSAFKKIKSEMLAQHGRQGI